MANTPQAKKRIRRNARRTEVNGARVSRIRTFIKKVEAAIELGDKSAAAAALAGVARQPEAAGKIQTMMIIALALIESLVIYALLMFFMLQGKLPTLTFDQLLQLK